MTQRLIYVMGPSGAGKDSVLHGLREVWDGMPTAHWARRTITRERQAGGEAHESVSVSEFKRLQAEKLFALDWQANGLLYGVRAAELKALNQGGCVFVNGSRGYLRRFMAEFPAASIVHITASTEILRQRLTLRGRETAEDIAQRLERTVDLAVPKSALHINNDRSLDTAVGELRSGLEALLCANQA